MTGSQQTYNNHVSMRSCDVGNGRSRRVSASVGRRVCSEFHDFSPVVAVSTNNVSVMHKLLDAIEINELTK